MIKYVIIIFMRITGVQYFVRNYCSISRNDLIFKNYFKLANYNIYVVVLNENIWDYISVDNLLFYVIDLCYIMLVFYEKIFSKDTWISKFINRSCVNIVHGYMSFIAKDIRYGLYRFAKGFMNTYKTGLSMGYCHFSDVLNNKAACTLFTAASRKLVSERRV